MANFYTYFRPTSFSNSGDGWYNDSYKPWNTSHSYDGSRSSHLQAGTRGNTDSAEMYWTTFANDTHTDTTLTIAGGLSDRTWFQASPANAVVTQYKFCVEDRGESEAWLGNAPTFKYTVSMRGVSWSDSVTPGESFTIRNFSWKTLRDSSYYNYDTIFNDTITNCLNNSKITHHIKDNHGIPSSRTKVEVVEIGIVAKIQIPMRCNSVVNGSCSSTNYALTDYNTTKTFTITPSTGYNVINPSYSCKLGSTGQLSSSTSGNNLIVTVSATQGIDFIVTLQPNTYTVTYNGNGSTYGSIGNSNCTYDANFNLPSSGFIREHEVTYDANGGSCSTASDKVKHTLSHWNTRADNNGTRYSLNESVKNLTPTDKGTVPLYAQWVLNSISLPTPTKVGYTFTGWYTSDNKFIGMGGASYEPAANITLHAQWKQNFYTITWANAINGESVVQNNVGGGTDPVYPYGTPIKSPDENINGYHYHFNGYDKALEKVGRNITYTAQFTSEKHDFTKLPVTVVEPGKDGNGVDYQGYDIHHCNNCEWTYNDNYLWRVIFNHEDGYSLTNQKVPNGTLIFPPSDYQITDYDDAEWDYEFDGWERKAGDDGKNETRWKDGAKALGNLIYRAIYPKIKKKYTIKWYDGNGDFMHSELVEYGKVPEPPKNPTKKPTNTIVYEHIGWKLIGKENNGIFSVTGDASYQAQFIDKIRYYTVKWMNPGVDVPLEVDDDVQYLDLPDYNGPIPVHPDDVTDKRYDYEFIGWSVEVKEPFDENWTGGDYPQDDDLPPVITDIIYTAVYKKTITQYQIKAYVLLGDTTDYCVYYDELEYQEPIIIDAWYFGQSIGYDFVKWEDGSTDIQRKIVVEDNAEYRAIYTKKFFNVRWLDYNGRPILSQELEYKTIPTIDNSKNPSRDHDDNYHYVFNGWKMASGMTTEDGEIMSDIVYVATYNKVKHKWSATNYEFSDNGWYCTASRDCYAVDGDEHRQEVIIKTIPTVRQGNEPTCTEMGYTTYIAIFKDDWNKQIDPITKTVQDIPAKGHELSLAQTIGKDSVNGCHYRYCRACTYVEISHHNWNNGIATTESSCFKGGKKRYNCKTPGCTAKHYEKIERIGHHQFGDTISEVAPTCTENGYRKHKRCQVCGLYFEITDDIYATGRPNKNSFIIEPLGHKYTEEVESTLVKANCYHDGSVEMLCANGCGTSQIMRIPRRQHNWDTGSITTQPTCATGGEGIKTYKCQNKENEYYEKCNGIKTETIPRLPHTIEITKGEAPTCIFKGRADKIWCSVCNEVLQKDYELPPLGHHYISRFLVPQENTLRREVEFKCDRKDCNHSYTLGFSD